jgi:protein SCO1/2
MFTGEIEMANSQIKTVALALLTAVILSACNTTETGITVTQLPSGGLVLNQTTPVADAVMTDHNSKQIHLNDLHGKYTLLFFGYTHCPDACPVTLSNFTRIRRILGTDSSKVNFVFVSIDPNRDSPDVIKNYVTGFDPDFIGLTADIPTLQTVATNFGAVFDLAASLATHDVHDMNATDSVDQIGSGVGHSTRSYLLDPQGRIKITYPLDSLPDPIAADLRGFLSGG